MTEPAEIRNILAIRFARLGDVILLLPALTAIKHSLPHAKLTLLTGHRCADIAGMCPAVDEVIAVDRIAMRDGPVRNALRDVKSLVSDIRARNFDAVVDFHSFRETNLLTWFSRAPLRVGMRRYNEAFLSFCFNRPAVFEDKTLHVSTMFRQVAGALPGVDPDSGEGPVLSIPESIQRWLAPLLPPAPRIVLYIDAPVPNRRWPAESFAAVADYAAEHLGAHPIVLAGPDGGPLAERVLRASQKPERLRVFGSLTLPQLAGVIGSSKLLISNDTGPMHMGPALGVRTLGLFSVGLPEHFRPGGKDDHFDHHFIVGMPIEAISIEQVMESASRMWASACLNPQR